MILSPRTLTVTSSMPGKKRKSEDGEAKEATKKPKPEKKNKSDTKWDEVEWASDAKTAEGKKWSLKLSSWNVDGECSWPIRGRCQEQSTNQRLLFQV